MKMFSSSACLWLALFLLIYRIDTLKSSIPDKDGKISDIVQELDIASLPSRLPDVDKDPLPGDKPTLPPNPGSQDDQADKFKVKHTYAWLGEGGLSSYDEFQKPGRAKEYLIEINANLLGGILQDKKNKKSFDKWFDELNKPLKVSIINDPYAKVNRAEKKDVTDRSNIKPGEIVKEKFELQENFHVVLLELEKTSSGFDIIIQEYKGKVIVSSSDKGNVFHFDGFASDDGFVEGSRKKVGSIPLDELKSNANNAVEFWRKEIGGKRKLTKAHGVVDASGVKNKYDKFLEAQNCKKATRGIVGVLGSCSIPTQPERPMDPIDPSKFIDDYNNADSERKRQLANLLDGNMDRIVGADLETRKMLEAIVETEKFKQHMEYLEKMTDSQDVDKIRGSDIEDPSKIVDKITDGVDFDNSKNKVSPSKVSHSIANSKYAKQFSSAVGSVADPLGKFFLTKSLINGIMNNDTTSLAIMGATVGFDFITDGISSLGKQFFAAASTAGKATKALGKLAGPIGDLADIGLNVWSLTKSVQRLQNATNKYDRNDAIADIVEASVSIAVTAAVTTLSAAFPPAAPLIMAVGFIIEMLTTLVIGVFKAANEVARINSEIKLSAKEKKEVFWSRALDFFGTRKKNYIDYLLEEKAANDAAVQGAVQFLRDNIDFLGIVIPSRTLSVDDSCTLTVRHCALKMFGKCVRWERRRTLGTGCSRGKTCGRKICQTYNQDVNSGYDEFICSCHELEDFSAPRKDSTVDFRRKQTLRWDRAVPSDVSDAVFKCKPGRIRDFDPRASEAQSRMEFLCEHAIGVLQPENRRRPDQMLLFDLDDGEDYIYLDGGDKTPNLFNVGPGGRKGFFGGGGRNEFIMNGTCTQPLSGTLSGGNSDSDSISIGSNCAKGGQMRIDFPRNLISGPGNYVNLGISNIEQINGRQNEADTVVASSSTKLISLNSGIPGYLPDIIEIPTGRYNLTIYVGEYTTLNSKASFGDVTALFQERWRSVSVTMDVHSDENLTNNILFLETASKEILLNSLSNSTGQSHVAIGVRNSRNNDVANFRFNFQPNQNSTEQQTIFFSEDFEMNSVLVVPLTNNPFVYHKLSQPTSSDWQPTTTITRSGSTNFENIFEIQHSNWIVNGGDLSDEFILQTPISSTTHVDGGEGEDKLRLHQNLTSPITINLKSQFRNIETITGHPGNPATVICDCNPKFIALQGGSSTHSDVIDVDAGAGGCVERDLQIIATGRTSITIRGVVGATSNDSVAVLAIPSEDPQATPMQLSIATTSVNTSGFYLTAQLTNTNWNVENVTFNSNEENALKFTLKHENEFICMQFVTLPIEDSQYVNIPFIQLYQNNSDAPPGQLLITSEDITPELFFYLNKIPKAGDPPVQVEGLRNVKNVFQIQNGTWSVIGGNKYDVVILNPTADIVHINGLTGQNTLVIEEGIQSLQNQVFLVNFPSQVIGFPHLENLGNLTQISHIFGRIDKPDEIHCNCETQTVNGRGGLQVGLEDEIIITPPNCPENFVMVTNIVVPSFTRVEHTATEGMFSYHIEDMITSSLHLNVTEDNLHFLDIALHPWEILEEVEFNETSSELTLEIQNSTKSHIFYMYRQENSSLFTNPMFEFHRPGSSVTSDIQISEDGITAATIVIQGKGAEFVQGLPVDINRILVNITQPEGAEGVILGGDKTTVNQFWLFDIQTSVGLLQGGANITRNYLDLAENFGGEETVEVILSNESGNVKVNGTTVISKLANIQHLQGRMNSSFTDIAYVTCDAESVFEVERIIIRASPKHCGFNLKIGIHENTTVEFEDDEEFDLSNSTENSIIYKFDKPRSFSIDYEESALIHMVTHTYLLAINLDHMESMRFDLEDEVLYYNIDGITYSHEMIGSISDGEQFFPQPVMITEDGFRIQVDGLGGIYLSLGAGSYFESCDMRSKVIPILSRVAKTTGATIIIQTDEEFVYVGHGEQEGDRNVLQNVGYTESHLVGGGARDTIYDIVNLDEDVFIYPGFEHQENDAQITEMKQKQTIDLSDIVSPIRRDLDKTYIPKVEEHKGDIYIEIHGYETVFPGKVSIIDGAKGGNERSFQFLLSNSLMDLVHDGVNWMLKPRPLLVPEGGIYTISREDFEDGQEISIETSSGLNSNATFHPARNGTSLIMTSLLDLHASYEGNKTTVIILDYFVEPSQQISTRSLNSRSSADVLNLKVSLPGLEMIISGSTVRMKLEMGSWGQSMPATELPSWNWAVQSAQERLMARIANVTEPDC